MELITSIGEYWLLIGTQAAKDGRHADAVEALNKSFDLAQTDEELMKKWENLYE